MSENTRLVVTSFGSTVPHILLTYAKLDNAIEHIKVLGEYALWITGSRIIDYDDFAAQHKRHFQEKPMWMKPVINAWIDAIEVAKKDDRYFGRHMANLFLMNKPAADVLNEFRRVLQKSGWDIKPVILLQLITDKEIFEFIAASDIADHITFA